MRISTVKRDTNETKIVATINLDSGNSHKIATGIGFFDHMLTAFAVHCGISVDITVDGDLNVDCHHTIEDAGIVLGMAFKDALGDKGGISRFGSAHIPMDEALAFASVDISGRPFLVFNGEFLGRRVGGMDTQMVEEFFRAFCTWAGITLHVSCLYGKNDHHKIEAMFKAVAHAIKAAIRQSSSGILSTKGVL